VALKAALEKAGELGIRGKDMTPFLLAEINRLTSGSSLAANKCLVENNVRVATNIAIFLSELRRTGGVTPWGGGRGGGGATTGRTL
jgi:pseudouridine-5'-phosphate glycosidase